MGSLNKFLSKVAPMSEFFSADAVAQQATVASISTYKTAVNMAGRGLLLPLHDNGVFRYKVTIDGRVIEDSAANIVSKIGAMHFAESLKVEVRSTSNANNTVYWVV